MRHGSKAFGRISRQATVRLVGDISLLLYAIRDVVLWDYVAVDNDDCHKVQMFLRKLTEDFRPARTLTLVQIGPSLFLALSVALARIVDYPLPGNVAGGELIAVDATLKTPRPCTEAERDEIHGQLAEIASSLRSKLRDHLRVLAIPLPGPMALIVAVHGWLLCYPVVYCYLQPDACVTAGTCLNGQSLHVTHVEAVNSLERDRSTHLVCSFSIPSACLPCASTRGCVRMPIMDVGMKHDAVSQNNGPILSRWRSEIQRRFDEQECWRLVRISTEVLVQQHVVL